jgi:hypothetical protein
LSFKLTVPFTRPTTVGLNVKLITQVALLARTLPRYGGRKPEERSKKICSRRRR